LAIQGGILRRRFILRRQEERLPLRPLNPQFVDKINREGFV